MNPLAALKPSRTACLIRLSRVRAKVKELEQLILELNRHPEATPETLNEARQGYMRASARLRELEARLSA